jgi:hypothetical protein
MHGLCVHSTGSLLVPQGIRSSIACSGNEPFYWSTRLGNPWLLQKLRTAMAGQYSTFQNRMEME